MNRNRIFIALAVAIVLGFVVSGMVYRVLSQSAIAKAAPIKTVNVIVAATHLPLGTRLDATHLSVVSWPAGSQLPGTFSRVEDCVGRALILGVVENEPILNSKLAPKEAGAGLPVAIPQGMRALSVAVNEVIGVAGFVLPGTMVDVLVTGASQNGPSGRVTRTLLENVPVLAAGQKIEQDKAGVPQTVAVITLLVSPEDANKLAMASTEGRIQLALRNTVDSKKTAPPPVFQATLFGGEAPPVKRAMALVRAPAAPPPPSTFGIEVIRGNKREVESFPNR